MPDQKQIDYDRIKKAILFIRDHFKSQPSLDEVAAAVHMSPFHFQRMFSEWAGVSPKKFMQYISIEHAKTLLNSNTNVLETAYATGLSGPSRLHDMFVTIEGMTPGAFKKEGEGLNITYSFAVTPFGKIIVAATQKGVCHMAFEEDEAQALINLRARFPKAEYKHQSNAHQQNALSIFKEDWQQLDKVKLHLAGSDFQIKVWESLLKIPMGALTTYGEIAKQIGSPKAARAVGTAIGSNPVAFIIPCHRVIQRSGKFGGYMWGPERKTALIGWEAAKTEEQKS